MTTKLVSPKVRKPKKSKAVDPLDDYFEAKKLAAANRKDEDANLVTQWQQQRAAGQVDPVLQQQVFSRFEPVRRAAVAKYMAPLTPPGFQTKSRTLLAEALGSWSPTGGAAPATHVVNQMRRLYRENLQQQSVQNTEADAGMFGPMDVARTDFMDEFEREPTQQELLTRMNEMLPQNKRIDAVRLQQLQSRRGGTALASGFESSPTSFHVQAENQNLDLLPYDLNNQELQVYNHLFGRGGQKATTSTNTIASRMGVSAPTVSRVRRGIAMKAGVTDEQLSLGRKSRKTSY